jgi:hypothetical protein
LSEQDPSANTQRPRSAVILEICIGVVFTAAAGYIALDMPRLVQQGGAQEAQSMLQLSPVFFPELSFSLTFLVSLIFLVQSVRRLPGAVRIEGSSGKNYWNVAVMCALVIIYASLLPLLGFGIATLLALGVTSYMLGARSWWRLAAFSVLTPVVIRFIFERVLYISLPLSSIGFLTNMEQSLMKFLVRLLLRG